MKKVYAIKLKEQNRIWRENANVNQEEDEGIAGDALDLQLDLLRSSLGAALTVRTIIYRTKRQA